MADLPNANACEFHGSSVVTEDVADWGQRLPEDSEALFAELLAMPQSELLSLLEVCVGFTVSAITSRESDGPAARLAQAVGLDMGQWWTPTAAGYFEHVSKGKALEAVQVFAPGEVHRLAKLKKAQIAAEAERLAAGSGWLPAMFRAPEAVTVDVTVTELYAEEWADMQEGVHAAASSSQAQAARPRPWNSVRRARQVCRARF